MTDGVGAGVGVGAGEGVGAGVDVGLYRGESPPTRNRHPADLWVLFDVGGDDGGGGHEWCVSQGVRGGGRDPRRCVG